MSFNTSSFNITEYTSFYTCSRTTCIAFPNLAVEKHSATKNTIKLNDRAIDNSYTPEINRHWDLVFIIMQIVLMLDFQNEHFYTHCMPY
jgi:hypothetical protein